jgi:quinol monooxygenase YgiN
MATVTALLDLRIKPESVSKAKETVESVLVATRAFPGCLGVDVLVDTEDEAHLLRGQVVQGQAHRLQDQQRRVYVGLLGRG